MGGGNDGGRTSERGRRLRKVMILRRGDDMRYGKRDI